ncbi:hypothetical protein EB118_06145 [bacterium]|nr:hypothetical protein [bacterium]
MALPTINNLKNRLGIGARANLFKVSLVWPENAAANVKVLSDAASILCKSAAIPAFTVGVIEVPFRGGRRIKVPGDRTFGDWTTTFLANDSQSLRAGFNAWLSFIRLENYDENAIRSNNGKGFDYLCDISVEHLNQSGETIRTYKLFDCFPTDVGAIDLSYDSTDTISEFTVTFQYHSMTAFQTSAISSSDVELNTIV